MNDTVLHTKLYPDVMNCQQRFSFFMRYYVSGAPQLLFLIDNKQATKSEFMKAARNALLKRNKMVEEFQRQKKK